MNRRAFMLITTAWVLAASVAARGQPAGASPRIAFLAGGSRAGDALLIEAFWRRMNELGYVEGRNIVAEYRFAEGVPERLPQLAAELVRRNVDVIVAPGSGARAAKKASSKIPIVITYGDPVGEGLAAQIARRGYVPGPNSPMRQQGPAKDRAKIFNDALLRAVGRKEPRELPKDVQAELSTEDGVPLDIVEDELPRPYDPDRQGETE